MIFAMHFLQSRAGPRISLLLKPGLMSMPNVKGASIAWQIISWSRLSACQGKSGMTTGTFLIGTTSSGER